MDPRNVKEVSISHLFDEFIEASTMRNVLTIHSKILSHAELEPCEFNVFFPRYKRAITTNKQKKNWKAKALFSKIDKRAAHKCYSNTKTSATIGNRTCDISLNITSHDVTDDKISMTYNNNNALQSYNCLVIGSGPAGLRTAIELQLLGASKVCIVEKRSRFSRNNVLHLWPFVIDDLKSLGAKKFYGKFCAGSIDHISIRQLQLILLKVCLMVGCDFRDSCSYMGLCPASIKQPQIATTSNYDISSDNLNETSSDSTPTCSVLVLGKKQDDTQESSLSEGSKDSDQNQSNNQPNCNSNGPKPLPKSRSAISGAVIESTPKRPDNLRGSHAHFECDSKSLESEMHSLEWDVIIGADGRRNTLSKFFPRKEFRGRLAIAITANFINRQTQAETSVPEISGLSFIYNQDMFNALAYDTNIQLENICYYKDDTHYFVMTAKKRSLLERGVLISDHATTQDLLSDSNVNKEALLKYAKDAAFWTTGLEPLDFALNHYGQEDCAMFDFTSMYAASNACKALRTKRGGFTLVGLVGDSLLEPFWPTGSGCARGFLSSFDAAWMCRQWAVNKCAVINYHGSGALRSAQRRANLDKPSSDEPCGASLTKMVVSPSTYDRMALSVMAERESIYRILAQTTSENLQQNYSHWTLNPHTRYPNLNRHLIMPAQVEHLISDGHSRVILGSQDSSHYEQKTKFNNHKPGNVRRTKSPNSSSLRKSPKKLKSAGASPIALPKNIKNRSKSLSKYYNSRNRQDLDLVDSYLDFEESYKNLADSDRDGMTQYLNYRQHQEDASLDDLFVPSLSGTLPSSNNLSRLEARRARDIDDCLRQRRQKSKINFVRDQLLNQLRDDGAIKSPVLSGGNAVLFNEIKRIREQHSSIGIARGDSKPLDINGPLSLLNSMRRCASFAERVKSFENKLVQTNQENLSSESTPNTPKTPIDKVKNLPQFATLQELIVNNASTKDGDNALQKSRIPVSKLSKDDWNVKCWESRVKRSNLERGESVPPARPGMSKAASIDAASVARFGAKPQKQVEVFQDRIKEMAEKLRTSKDTNRKLYQPVVASLGERQQPNTLTAPVNNFVRSQGWINHLKRELVKDSNVQYNRSRQPMNPVAPNKPIKKLFDDDERNNYDGINVNKHYDHLCIYRPTNKYLAKGTYTSHLARANENIINRAKPTAEIKQAYMASLTSRGSSASSTLSDYSTNTVNSSSGSTSKQQQQQQSPAKQSYFSVMDVDCARCKKFVSTSDRITIGQSTLHRICLTCASCRLTLRSNEIQHYLNRQVTTNDNEPPSFLCAICKPDIRAELSREADDRLAELANDDQENTIRRNSSSRDVVDVSREAQSARMQSREEFFNSRVNYNELYRNILPVSSEAKSAPNCQDNATDQGHFYSKVPPSPLQVTLPMRLISNSNKVDEQEHARDASVDVTETTSQPSFKVATCETVNGSELVTLILPPSTTPGAEADDDQRVFEREIEEGCDIETSYKCPEQQHNLIDEEELHRLLHLNNNKHDNKVSRKTSDASSSTIESCSSEIEEDEDDQDENTSSQEEAKLRGEAEESLIPKKAVSLERVKSSDDDSSSFEISPELEDFEDDDEHDENFDPNSTCHDVVTSEEFNGASPNSENNSTYDELSKSLPVSGDC